MSFLTSVVLSCGGCGGASELLAEVPSFPVGGAASVVAPSALRTHSNSRPRTDKDRPIITRITKLFIIMHLTILLHADSALVCQVDREAYESLRPVVCGGGGDSHFPSFLFPCYLKAVTSDQEYHTAHRTTSI